MAANAWLSFWVHVKLDILGWTPKIPSEKLPKNSARECELGLVPLEQKALAAVSFLLAQKESHFADDFWTLT
jgi:hypothetical protein